MFVVRADSPYRRIEDLRGKPVAFGAQGSGLVILAKYVLDGLGLDRDRDFTAIFLERAGDGPAMVLDGRAAALWGAGVGWPGFTTMASAPGGARFIVPDADGITRILAKHAFLRPLRVAPGSYPGQTDAIASVGSWSFIMTRPTLPDDVAYRLARALHRGEAAARREAGAGARHHRRQHRGRGASRAAPPGRGALPARDRSPPPEARGRALVAVLALVAAACAPIAPDAPKITKQLDAPYVATPPEIVTAMLRAWASAPPTSSTTSARAMAASSSRRPRSSARAAVGVELDPALVQQSRDAAFYAGVADRATFVWKDIFEVDLSPATVVTIYLFPEVNARLVPKLRRELRPGTRIVSHQYPLGDWAADRWTQVKSNVRTHTLLFWTVPAR